MLSEPITSRLRDSLPTVRSGEPMKSDLIDIAGMLHHETEKAILFSDDGNRATAIWLPKSAIEIERDTKKPGIVTVTLPERLAIDRGLV